MSEPIPMVDLRRGGPELDAEFEAAFRRVLTSGRYILGPEVEALERECADYLGVRHAVGVSSGTDALLVSLMAAGVGPGDEVICPTYTFFATAGAIWRLGAKPVFVDCEPDGFNLDAGAVEARVTGATRAIVPVHLFGRCAAIGPLVELAEARRIALIEDAAQAIGAELGGRRAGSLGTMGCFSFFPSKNLGCFGDGGLVTTDDDALAERIRTLRVHGGKPKYHHRIVGGNFRLDPIQAAVLRVKLPRLDEAVRRRQAHAAAYREALEATSLVLPPPAPDRHVWNQFVVRFPDGESRDRARAGLADRGIATAIYYPVPLHLQPCFAELGYAEGDFPIAEAWARRSLALPIFPELEESERLRVVEALLDELAR